MNRVLEIEPLNLTSPLKAIPELRTLNNDSMTFDNRSETVNTTNVRQDVAFARGEPAIGYLPTEFDGKSMAMDGLSNTEKNLQPPFG